MSVAVVPGCDCGKKHDDAAALSAWKDALAFAPASEAHSIQRRFASHAMLEGDLSGYKKWIDTSGEPPNYLDWAKRTLRQSNDPSGARALLKKWPQYDETSDEQFIPSPGDGEAVVE